MNLYFCISFDLIHLFFKQDYSKLHHVEVIVNAALHLDNTKNTVRMNANTQVIEHSRRFYTVLCTL